MRKILFVNANGLGDHIMCTPALKKFKELNPDTYIAVAGQKRFGKTLKSLLSGLPYIDEVITILPDPWEDGVQHYQRKLYEEVVKVADEYGAKNQFHQGVLLPTAKQDGYRLHKIFRFESEVGVSFTSMEDLQTEVNVQNEYIIKAEAFLSKYQRPIALVHNDAGNPPKEFTDEELNNMLANFKEYTIVEFGKDIDYEDMEFTKAVIQCADLIIAIDSVVMHIAGALQKPLVALFKSTPAHQAIPLTYNITCYGFDNEITQLSKVPEYKYKISEVFGLPEFKVDDDVIIQKGLGSSDGSGFNYEKYKQIQFDVEKYDGEPRLTLEAHGEEAVKFYKEVEKYLPDELIEGDILDVGGNHGYHSKTLSKKYNRHVDLIDINPDIVKVAIDNCKDFDVSCNVMDINDIKLKNASYSLIFAKDILEHVIDPDKVIKKLYKLLKDGGSALIFMPLDGSATGVESIDLGLSDGYCPHMWKSTYKSCVDRFEKAGFKVESHKLLISDITGRERPFGNEAIILIGKK